MVAGIGLNICCEINKQREYTSILELTIRKPLVRSRFAKSEQIVLLSDDEKETTF